MEQPQTHPVIDILRGQRNAPLDWEAVAEANLVVIAAQVGRLQDEIATLHQHLVPGPSVLALADDPQHHLG